MGANLFRSELLWEQTCFVIFLGDLLDFLKQPLDALGTIFEVAYLDSDFAAQELRLGHIVYLVFC